MPANSLSIPHFGASVAPGGDKKGSRNAILGRRCAVGVEQLNSLLEAIGQAITCKHTRALDKLPAGEDKLSVVSLN